jgi:glycosyltransferase involved in cell wall biosynthesis
LRRVGTTRRLGPVTDARDKRADKGGIVLVARHYPPMISGGTRRASLLAKGLRERGWRVRVASPRAPEGEPDWIDSPHPAALRGERAMNRQTNAPTRAIEKLATIARRTVYWPDADMRWALGTARIVEAVVRGDRPDWIVTSSPPESVHLVGTAIKRRSGIRWLAELRDSWIEEPLREELLNSRVRRFVERRIARSLLQRADHIVAVSEPIAREVASFDVSCPISLIGHFAEPYAATRTFPGTGPHLLHTGQFSLSHPQRTLQPVLDAFLRVLATHPNAHLHLIGRLTHAESELARRHAANPRTVLHGPLPYADARAYQNAADALILYQPDTAALPGKLSEYLLCTAPILTVGSGRWMTRMADIPHWPLEDLAAALLAVRRQPVDAFRDSIDRYEAILNDQSTGVRPEI